MVALRTLRLQVLPEELLTAKVAKRSRKGRKGKQYFFAIFAASAMSMVSRFGLVGLSRKSTLVFGRTARRVASAIRTSACSSNESPCL